jgi:hypothetical protein
MKSILTDINDETNACDTTFAFNSEFGTNLFTECIRQNFSVD